MKFLIAVICFAVVDFTTSAGIPAVTYSVPVPYAAVARPFAGLPAATSYSYRAPTTQIYTVPVEKPEIYTAPIASTQYHAQDSLGAVSYGYSTSDGTSKTETRDYDGTVRGEYKYYAPEGDKVELKYIADKKGFQPEGDHLPVQPEVPDKPDYLEDAYEDAKDSWDEIKDKIKPVTPYAWRHEPYSYNGRRRPQGFSYTVPYPTLYSGAPSLRAFSAFSSTRQAVPVPVAVGTPGVGGFAYTTGGHPLAGVKSHGAPLLSYGF